jgi:hypothetical protein
MITIYEAIIITLFSATMFIAGMAIKTLIDIRNENK